jgi:GNAT superfamily N-acetyltransferase
VAAGALSNVFWAEREPGKAYAQAELDAITELLHRAYAPLGARGLNYTAVDQDARETRRRLEEGTTVLGRIDGVIVASGTVYLAPYTGASITYGRFDTGRFGQFAVEPAQQRRGIASELLRRLEGIAAAAGCQYLACDTAAAAVELQQFYLRRGYATVERVRWPGKTYESIILRKTVRPAGR